MSLALLALTFVMGRAVGDGWTSRRTGWRVVAFAIGIAVTRFAARPVGVVGPTLGLSTTFLAAVPNRESRRADDRKPEVATSVVDQGHRVPVLSGSPTFRRHIVAGG